MITIGKLFSRYRLVIQESSAEVALRGTLGLLLLLSSYMFPKTIIGTYNLASSIAVFIGGIFSAGWIYRISISGIRKLDAKSALFQILNIYILICLGMNIYFVSYPYHKSLIFQIALNSIVLNSSLVAVLEVIWSHRNEKGELVEFSIRKWFIVQASCVVFILIFLLFKSIYALIFLQPVVSASVVFSQTQALRQIFSSKPITKHSFGDLKNYKQFIETLKLGFVGSVSMLTFVIDNLLIAYKYNLAHLPSYSIAFACISIAIGIIGTPVQRIFSVKEASSRDFGFIAKAVLMVIILSCLTTFLVAIIVFFFKNPILEEAIGICFALFPYAIGRIVSMLLVVRIGQYGRMATQWRSNLIYLMIVSGGILMMPKNLSLIGVALIVSTASLVSTSYILKIVHKLP